MSFLSRSASRFIFNSIRSLPSEISSSLVPQSQHSIRQLTRPLVVLSSSTRTNLSNISKRHSLMCSCGCGSNGIHTKGDQELLEFLNTEIDSEKKNLSGSVPSKLNDFTIKKDEAELTLTKKFHDEEITISLNVNHTVDSESEQIEGGDEAEGELKSRPDFEVDLKIGSKVVSFTCQFTPPVEGQSNEDVFGISEVTFYEGDWTEKQYCVSGDILDGVMYDLLMNMLDERGVSNDFAEKLCDLSTNYEHGLYVNLLENVKNFIQRK